MNWAVRQVWLRYFAVFRKGIVYALVTTLTEPFLYLLSFGFGLGSLIGHLRVDGVQLDYRPFILAGIVGQTLLFQGFFEAAYGAFIRMYYQKIFQAIATTPVTLGEVLWELLWDASKGTFAATAVLTLGAAIGDFPVLRALACVPIAFVAAFLFAGLGLWVASLARNIEQISYPQYLIVFPMFLFCGVFFPLDRLPHAVLLFAWLLPLTSILSLLRSVLLDLPFHWQTIPITLTWLAVLVLGSRRAMTQRLVK